MKLDLKDLRAKAEQQVAYFNKYPRDTVALKHEDPAVMLALLDQLKIARAALFEIANETENDDFYLQHTAQTALAELDAEEGQP